MLSVIFILSILAALLLIGLVLIQPGKGDMMSGMGGLNLQFNAAFGSSKATNILTRATWTMAIAILVFTLVANVFLTKNTGQEQQLAPTEKVDAPINNQAPPVGIQQSAPPTSAPPAQQQQAPATKENTEEK